MKRIILFLILVVLISGCTEKIIEEQPIREESSSEQTRKCSNEGEFCGGIAGIMCCEGLKCQLDGNYPDAGGECIIGATKTKELCEEDKEYMKFKDPNGPLLSIPFDAEDYSTKYWGIVPFCAKLRHSNTMHGALDFELKPDSKVFAATDGIIEHTQVGREEGSGEIISVRGDGFALDYSGLTNLQVKKGDEIKKGDYIANAVLIPHGEHHLHLGITINGRQECPLKYMDKEFKEAFEQMFAQADYRSQTTALCACNCESLESK